MSRALTPAGLVRLLTDAGIVPSRARSERRGSIREWVDRGLRFRLVVGRPRGSSGAGVLDWTLFVGPSGPVGDPYEHGGLNAWIGLAPPGEGVDTSALDVDELATAARSAVAFVEGLPDYVRLLLTEHPVDRGGISTRLRQGYPACVVKARELAKEIDRPDLVAEVDALLDSGVQVSVAPTVKEDIRIAATRWAVILSKESGRRVTL